MSPSRSLIEGLRHAAHRVSGVVPAAVLDRGLARLIALMKKRHGRVFRRLADYSGQAVLIAPEETAFALVLRLDADRPGLAVHRGEATVASIRGTFPALVGLLEGRIDGDALFFSRELAVEGDTELVVALRNAVDGAGIDLIEDVCSVFGPAAGPAEILARRTVALGRGLRLAFAERP
ncbi:MAG: hypothetical protein FJX47_11075 [Alphaproteobacteria bacterium]|nr:hypothetical protein [Alphaproteobacteria bacterium]